MLQPLVCSVLFFVLMVPQASARHYDDSDTTEFEPYEDEYISGPTETKQDVNEKLDLIARTTGTCFPLYPYPYKNGQYCCQSQLEGVRTQQGEGCDGGPLSNNSTCCKDNKFKKCQDDSCIEPIITTGSCPLSHPNAYSSGKYCCLYDYEKTPKTITTNTCDGGPISIDSKCCFKDEYSSCPYDLCTSVASDEGTETLLIDLEQQIIEEISDLGSLQEFKDYLSGDDSLKVLQWELVNNIIKSHRSLSLEDETVSWIFNDKTMLESIITSGDVDLNLYKEAIDIIAEIIRQDPEAKSGLRLRIAVAIGLTFSSDVPSYANSAAKPERYPLNIDGIARYHNFTKWADEGIFLEPFYTLNTWEMRYVVGSWATDEEMVWARENALEDYRVADKIGEVTHPMMTYTNAPFATWYDGKALTLAVLYEYGAVCGGISKFGTAMAQSFGIPSLPVGQPGHCAFIWLRNGTFWKISNDITGWSNSQTHLPVMYSWKRPAAFFTLMHEAQQKADDYRLSEKMRILATSFVDHEFKYEILEDATNVCAQNYDLYEDLKEALGESAPSRDLIEEKLVPALVTYYEGKFEITKDVAYEKIVTASAFQSRAWRITDGSGSQWFSNETAAWVEIDLEYPCTIEEVSINWWGNTYSDDYEIIATIDNSPETVRTRSDEEREDVTLNPWGVLPGWEGKTTKIRMEMREGHKDVFFSKYYFGIRRIELTGKEHIWVEDVAFSKPVSTNIAGTGQELVDGDLNTYWTSDVTESEINVQFEGLCVLHGVLIDWLDSPQGIQEIRYLAGGETHDVGEWGEYTNATLHGYGSELDISLNDSDNYSIRDISAFGTCFSMSDIFKMKVSQCFIAPESDYSAYVLEDINSVIDGFACDTCY